MGWIVVAVALAGVVPGTGGGQEPGVAHRASGPPDAPRAAMDCEAAGLARQAHDALLRLCMPGDPLVLRASYRWEPDLPGARDALQRWHGWENVREGRPPLDATRGYGAGGEDGGSSTRENREGAGSCADGASCATTTPEPVTLLLLGSGLAGVAGARYRRRRQALAD